MDNLYAIIIHGGAGNGSIKLFDKLEANYEEFKNLRIRFKESLDTCSNIGKYLLENGKLAVDAVEECIRYLEDNELFNAGIGAVKDEQNQIYHDACITEGKDFKWGAICMSQNIKNPISLVRALMENENRLICGNGVNIIAKKYEDKRNIVFVDNSYFRTNFRDKLDEVLEEKVNFGTVGVVALDKYGNICAGTSTGGLSKKPLGRIGDSPLIGISTIADNNYCGISCTGKGEEFIRHNVASNIKHRMEYLNESLKDAIDNTLNKLNKGTGGIIGLDKNGNVYSNFNTKRMYRSYYNSKEDKIVSEIW